VVTIIRASPIELRFPHAESPVNSTTCHPKADFPNSFFQSRVRSVQSDFVGAIYTHLASDDEELENNLSIANSNNTVLPAPVGADITVLRSL
jgi:hypothetical protein